MSGYGRLYTLVIYSSQFLTSKVHICLHLRNKNCTPLDFYVPTWENFALPCVIGQKADIGPNLFKPRGRVDLVVGLLNQKNEWSDMARTR
jgi:hypothetical protein